MSQYKNILVAIDTSDEAEQVLARAIDIAESDQASIRVIHVAALPVAVYGQWGMTVPVYDENEIREAIEKNLSAKIAAAGIENSALTINYGRPVSQICNEAENAETDLIVIGSHGRHGAQLLLGSTANGVLHHSKIDVLAVRISE